MKLRLPIALFSIIAAAVVISAARPVSVNRGAQIAKNQVAKASTVKVPAERPDMNKIKDDVTDPQSRYYYPKLMKRYEQNETIMTLDDYRHLYLGAVFQEDYNPYRRSPFDSKIDELYYKNDHTRAELDTIISYAESALRDDPFDLSQINFLIYALRKRGKANRANIWQFRLNHLLQAILSTGTGADTANAWVVIDPKHEYNIINFQNALAEEAKFVEPYYDYILIRPDNKSGTEKRPDGYYFNIHYILREYYRKFPEADK